jgi:hypothetical protein
MPSALLKAVNPCWALNMIASIRPMVRAMYWNISGTPLVMTHVHSLLHSRLGDLQQKWDNAGSDDLIAVWWRCGHICDQSQECVDHFKQYFFPACQATDSISDETDENSMADIGSDGCDDLWKLVLVMCTRVDGI